ncbi:MAG: hypothetical protein JW795_15635, partial [Chitinivibrionales bacterium]|nr:hypothetical protein [Chitinivibrionales bacterium]
CSVRCYFNLPANARLMLNGAEIAIRWHQPSLQPHDDRSIIGSYSDLELRKGLNSVVCKMVTPGGVANDTYFVSLYAIRDSLAPIRKAIDNVGVHMSKQLLGLADSLSVRVSVPVSAPPWLFSASLRLTVLDSMDTHAATATIPLEIERDTTISLPKNIRGAIGVSAEVTIGRQAQTLGSKTRFLWRGDFVTAQKNLSNRCDSLHRVLGMRGNSAFEKLFSEAVYRWIQRTVRAAPRRSLDRQIPDFMLVSAAADALDTLAACRTIPGKRSYPFFFTCVPQPIDRQAMHRDPADWLVYTYPRDYSFDTAMTEGGYEAWLWLPEPKKQKKRMPLIVALHDGDSRGDDLGAIANFGPQKYATEKTRFKFAVCTPLCPRGVVWNGNWITQIIDTLASTGNIDKKRIYGTGTGMGGFAVWHCGGMKQRPFAAIAPISAAGSPAEVQILKTVPTWMFHGGNDKTVPVEFTHTMIRTFKEVNAKKYEYSIFAEYGHSIADVVYHDERLYTWFLKWIR